MKKEEGTATGYPIEGSFHYVVVGATELVD